MKTVHSKLLLLLVILGLLFAAVVGFLNYLHDNQLQMITSDLRTQRQQSFEQIMQLQGSALKTVSFDYTFWDDMAIHVETPDFAWFQENLDESLKTFDANSFWVYKPDISLAYSVANTTGDLVHEGRCPFVTLIGKGPLSDDKRLYHFFFYDKALGLWEIRGATIHRSTDVERKGTPEGYFFAGRLWGSERLQALSKLTRSDVSLAESNSDPLLAPGHRFSTGDPIVIYLPLQGLERPVERYLRFSFSTPFVRSFHERTLLQYLTLLSFIGILLLTMVLALTRWVFAPLSKVSEALDTESDRPIKRLAEEHNEFGEMAALIEEFFEQRKVLEKSEETLKALISSIPGAVYRRVMDPEWRMDFVSGPIFELTGYPAQEFVRKHVYLSTLVHSEDRDKIESAVQFAMATRTPYVIEYRITAKDNTVKWVQDKGRIVTGPHGSDPRLHGVLFDITALKQMERQLLQSQKMETVGTLAGGIAHDLNNQLTPLLGYINLIQSQMDKKDPNYEMLMEADHATHRAAEIVQKLVAFSRRSSQKKSVVSVQLLVGELSQTFSKFLPSTIACTIKAAPDIWPIYANETEIQTLLMNLAINARDAISPKGGLLEISAANLPADTSNAPSETLHQPCVLLRVKDNGKGISPDVLPHIFEPFFTTKKSSGTGLGLAMVFMIVKDHGGTISVSSDPGHGTEFSVYLPARPGESVVGQEDGGQQALKTSKNHELILLADDEESVRHVVRLFLEKLGYRVLTTSDGEETLRVYKEKQAEISAVLLDMTMPKMTGRQCLQSILQVNSKARVLLVSGFTAEGSAKELILEGAMDFLSKPYTISVLAETLHKTLTAHR